MTATCFLVTEGGQHILYNSSGVVVDGLLKTVTTDGLPDEEQTCVATIRVKICTKEEMQKAVKKENMVEVKLQQPIHVQTAKKSRIWGWK